MARQPNENPPPTTWRKRLTGVAAGGSAVAIGLWLVAHGIIVGTSERYRQPVFSHSAIAMGVILVLVSLAPAGLIIKTTALKKYRPYKSVLKTQGAIEKWNRYR